MEDAPRIRILDLQARSCGPSASRILKCLKSALLSAAFSSLTKTAPSFRGGRGRRRVIQILSARSFLVMR
jgi:hypothetical protein